MRELNKQNKSVYELCKACGIHAGSFSNTKNNPNSWKNAGTLYAISRYLHVSPDYLITGQTSGPENNRIIEELKLENGKLRQELKDSKVKISALLSTISELLASSEQEKLQIHKEILTKLQET